MKNIKLILTATLFTGLLTACGGSTNSLPPTSYYPNRLLQAQQNSGQFPTNPNLGDPTLPTDVTQGQIGSIVGRVVNRSGRPLHNVLISLDSDPSINTKSRRGDFTLMNIPVGQHTLIIELGNVQTQINVNVLANAASAPEQNPIQLDGEVGSAALAFANPNRHVGSYKVDQDFLNAWQPKGIAVANGTLYISAISEGLVSKKGTVISIDAGTGEDWKNMTKKWFGLKHGLKSSARGVSMNDSGNLLVVDEKGGIYSIDPSSGEVTKNEAGGALDIAAGGGKVYIYSARGLEVSDDSGQGAAPVAGITPSGNIGADTEGNAYVPVQNTIKKVSSDGEVTTLIKDYLNTPSDVAIDSRNGDIYVLDSGDIKRYDKSGEFVVSFRSGALDPVAIATDEEGALYVADFGRTQRFASSVSAGQVMKFEPVVIGSSNTAQLETQPAADVEAGEEILDDTATEGDEFIEDEFADEETEETLEEL